MSDDASDAGYVVPTYRETEDPPWYHFLHGNVPGHQIDFMYRAEVPQGPLTRQHFSHLARLMKYIEPQAGCPYAFAIGNLSRDDTQHEPGHGGVALMFGLRIQGVTDHAGRQDPPFAHAVAAIDRDLDRTELLAAAGVFHRHVLAAAQSAEWYRSYVRCAAEAPAGMTGVLADYVAGFGDLPAPAPSALGLKWTVGETTPPARVVIVHDDDAPFGMIAACAAKIAAVLFPSDIRWSAISNGREADLPNGVTVRLVAASNVTPADEARGAHRIAEIPDDEEAIAQQLFGAVSATVVAKPVTRGWRDKYAGASATGDDGAVDGQRSSYAADAPGSRKTPPPAQGFDVAATKVWDRVGAGAEAQDEVDIDVDQASSELAAPVQPRSTPPPPLNHRAPKVDVARPSPPPVEPYNGASAQETRLMSVEAARAAANAVLPFTPVPTPRPALSASPWEATPDFRAPTSKWRGPAVWLGLGALTVVAIYLLFGPTPEKPAPDPTPPPASAVPVPTIESAPPVALTASAVSTASVAPAAPTAPTAPVPPKTRPLKATPPAPSVKPTNQDPGRWKPRSVLDGDKLE